MKRIIQYAFLFLALVALGVACNEDLGNYDYDFENVPEIKIDTAGVDRTGGIFGNWALGDTVNYTPTVTYPGRENRLVYRWFVIDWPYNAVVDGNSSSWPKADTISRTQDLNYIVGLTPGKNYQLWFMAQDSVNGNAAYMVLLYNFGIPEAGSRSGVYCLQQKEGRWDMDVIGSNRALVFSNFHEVNYYSTLHPNEPIQGAPRLFTYSSVSGAFYLFTEAEEALRISPVNMAIMDRWEDMFYQLPAYNPQAVAGVNGCDFLINNGKLHVYYKSTSSARKFSVAIPGSYDLAPALATATLTSWGAVPNAINAYQIVFDRQSRGFRPYFNKGTSLGRFQDTDEETATTLFDVNDVEGELLFHATVNGGETMAVMKQGSDYRMEVACFYNVVDNGKLARYSKSLAGCENIASASCFCAGNGGPALFYSAGNKVYSYSYATGQTASNLLWEGNSGDEITALCLLPSGGFPTAGRIFWIAVWNEGKQEGRLVEFEINPVSGLAEALYAPMFTGIEDNPIYHEGLGKVVRMCINM